MTKTFKQYLDRVELHLATLGNYRNDDDLRLFLFCRLMTVAEHCRAKAGPQSTAAMLFRQYVHQVERGDVWWRSGR